MLAGRSRAMKRMGKGLVPILAIIIVKEGLAPKDGILGQRWLNSLKWAVQKRERQEVDLKWPPHLFIIEISWCGCRAQD